jgi:hypothetical protein
MEWLPLKFVKISVFVLIAHIVLFARQVRWVRLNPLAIICFDSYSYKLIYSDEVCGLFAQ